MKTNYRKSQAGRMRTLSRRMITVILSFVMVFTMMPWLAPEQGTAAAASYDSRFRYWSQGSSDYYYMQQWGCNVVAHSKLLYEAGAGGGSFNPDTLYNWGRGNGSIESSSRIASYANCAPKYAQSKGVKLTLLGLWGASDSQLWSYINSGYYTVLGMRSGSGTHFVYVDNEKSKATGKLYIDDSSNPNYYYGPRLLSAYNGWARDKAIVYKGSQPVTYTVSTGSASKITNNTATISGSVSPSCNVNSWGFYLGTNSNSLKKYTVSAKSTASSNMKADVQKYVSLKFGTKYYYKVWANVPGGEKSGKVSSFATTSVKPDIPTLKANGSKTELGVGDAPIVTWNSVANASSYKLYLYDSNNRLIDSATGVQGTKHAFQAVTEPGTYSAYVEAVNDVGSKGRSNAIMFTVHPDVTVTFKDADGFVDAPAGYVPEVLAQVQVHYGHDANAPSAPVHNGYTFKEWSGSYKAVTEDTVVKAVYDINKYTVTFIDSRTGDVLDTQKVQYYSAASLVDFTVPDGYVKTGYDGWDKDYSCITGNTQLYTCIGWYNDNLPVFTRIVSATREYDAEVSDNEGYTIVAKITNNDNSVTKGRLVVSLKTSEGKLLTSTESAAFAVKKGTNKDIEVFVPYDKAAMITEVYVVGQYADAVPISNSVTADINQENTYSNWSTEVPPADKTNVQQRTEYSYSDKQTTTSYNTSLSGYTQNGGSWVQQSSGTIDYVSSWPSGFNKSSSQYKTYNKSPKTASETTTDKTTVSTSTVGYIYWHWCRGTYTSGPINRLVSDCKEGEFGTWHAFTQSSAISYNSSAGAYQSSRGDVCKDTYWWLSTYCNNGTQLPIRRCTYKTYKKLFNYYKWSDYTAWSTTAVTANDNRRVNTRTVYRYQDDCLMEEDNSGEERVISGSLGSSFAGKEATLFIYKVDEASDYTNEYLSQQKLGDNGEYSFTFKLREEPTVKTGDFTVVLGVEGTTSAIYLDTIEAPKPEYTVRFFNANNELISEQTVLEGDSAELPDESELEKTGYTFTRWSDTNVNVRENRDIYPEYKINKYNVVFVDWKANTVTMEEFEYGAQLITPVAEMPEDGQLVEWVYQNEDEEQTVSDTTVVTGNMIVTTKYTTKELEIQIKDETGNLKSVQHVDYGRAVSLPDVEEADNQIFLGWECNINGETTMLEDTVVTTNMILSPRFTYSETVENPQASVATGEYSEDQNVTLSCSTAGADIFYTVDGSEPTSINSMLYTEPITISDATVLKFYASKAGMNDSGVVTEYYVVNSDQARSPYMLYDNLPAEVRDNASAYDVSAETGYRYKDTRTTTSIAEANILEASGWSLKDTNSYTEYSDWSDVQAVDDGSYVGMEEDTQDVYDESSVYEYSHYVYQDGDETIYSANEVAGFDCTRETVQFVTRLSVAGFEDGKSYFIYDGQYWYNQTKITAQVKTGTRYRYRYKIATYEKWTDYTLTAPSPSETRDYEEQEVYSYIRHKQYLVTIHDTVGTGIYSIVEEGKKLDIDKLIDKDMPGLTYEGLYKDEELQTAFDPSTDTISASMDLFVKRSLKTYTVTFAYEDGTEIASESAEYMGAVTPPEVDDIS